MAPPKAAPAHGVCQHQLGRCGGRSLSEVWNNPNNDTAVFGGTAGTITLGTDITVGGLTFTAAYTLTGGTVTFGAPGTISNSANVTIASALAGAEPITKSGAGTLTLLGANNNFSGDHGHQWRHDG